MSAGKTKREHGSRLRAIALLLCFIVGPLQAMAAPLLQMVPGCCATDMCPLHKAHKAHGGAPLCPHQGKGMTPECAMHCGMNAQTDANILPAFPRVIPTAVSTPADVVFERAMDAAPQFIFASELVTVPVPAPVLVIVSVQLVTTANEADIV